MYIKKMSEEQRDEEESCIGHGLVAQQHHGKSSSDNDMNAILHSALNNDGPPLAAADNKTNDNRYDDTAVSPESDQNKSNLRRGKWTPEEEAYARAVISDFNSGYLDAPIGTTLRAFLSTKLECDPMRVTKKFTKEDSLGKKVFRPAVESNAKIAKEVEVAQVSRIQTSLLISSNTSCMCVITLTSSLNITTKEKSCFSIPKVETEGRNAKGGGRPKVIYRSISLSAETSARRIIGSGSYNCTEHSRCPTAKK